MLNWFEFFSVSRIFNWRLFPVRAVQLNKKHSITGCFTGIRVSFIVDVDGYMWSMIGRFRYFYLFKLSYLYSAVIGFTITFTIGYLASRLLQSLNFSGTDKVYKDQNKNLINYDLFFPPIAKSLRKQHAKRDILLSHSNNLLNVSVRLNNEHWTECYSAELSFILDGATYNKILDPNFDKTSDLNLQPGSRMSSSKLGNSF